MNAARDNRVLIVGALPPVPSIAAQWTQLICERLTTAGIEVVVLIDELCPPPFGKTPFKTVRSFDQEFTQGTFDDWPRLVVVGGQPDSLPQISFLERSPSTVLGSDQSLFKLACARTVLSHDAANFRGWLEQTFNQAGKTLGNALFNHKRFPTEIAKEISAFGYLLPEKSDGVGLTKRQTNQMECDGIAAQTLPSAILEAATAGGFGAARQTLCVIGMQSDLQADFEANCSLPEHHSLKIMDRFSEGVIEDIAVADTIAILDGHEAALCPLAVRAISSGKHVIVADQPWVADLPPGSVDAIPHAQAVMALTHALQFAVAGSGKQSSVEKTQAPSPDNTHQFAHAVLKSAASAKVSIQHTDDLHFDTPDPLGKTRVQTSPTGIWSLVGAIPVKPVLEQLFPQLDLDNCPRFLSLEHARYLAALTDTPLLSVAGQLGCEDVLVTDRKPASGDKLLRKTKPWDKLSLHLLTADKALAFGCTFAGAHQAKTDSPAAEAVWNFGLPENIADMPDLKQMFDPDTGMFWRYDTFRNTLSLLVATGGAGTLTLSIQSDQFLVVSDGTQTSLLTKGKSTKLTSPDHGMLLAKMTTMPQRDGETPDVRKILAGVPINLKWSPNA